MKNYTFCSDFYFQKIIFFLFSLPLWIMFVVSVMFRSVSFRCVLMDLPHPVCMHVFVCVVQSLRGQLQLHCCAPLSVAFPSELKPSHGISNFCFQPDYGSAARSSPIMIPSMVGYLLVWWGDSKRSSTTPTTNNYNNNDAGWFCTTCNWRPARKKCMWPWTLLQNPLFHRQHPNMTFQNVLFMTPHVIDA